MGYQIKYDKENREVVYEKIGMGRKKHYAVVLVLAVMLCCLFRKQIGEFLLPGDPDTTKEAITTFVAQLQDGESVTSALNAFYKVVIDEEKLS